MKKIKTLIIDNETSELSLKHLKVLVSKNFVVKKWNELENFEWKNFDLIILSGSSKFSVIGKESEVSEEKKIIMNKKIPVIGICWGAQLIAKSFGMELVKMDKKIYGKTEIEFNNWEKRFVFESHTWEIKSLTNDFKILATSKNFNNKKIIEFFEHKKYPIFGMQFHPAARLKNLEEDNFLDGDEIFFELLQKIF